MKSDRAYHQKKRAETTAHTRHRLLEVAIRLFTQRPYSETSLQAIAGAAGTTPQTLLRHFGSKETLFEAAFETALEEVREQRNSVPAGDLQAAVVNLAEHYEHWGSRVLNMLACEVASPEIARITAEGRKLHIQWVERAFGPQLALAVEQRRQPLLDSLIALTDVHFWQILRIDRGRSDEQYQATLKFLIEAASNASS